MELGAVLLFLGVLVIAFIFMAQPFTNHRRAKGQRGHEIPSLLANCENALNTLQELDFDLLQLKNL